MSKAKNPPMCEMIYADELNFTAIRENIKPAIYAYGFTVRFYRHCGEGWAEVVHSKDKNAQADAQVKSMEDRIMEFCKTAHTMKDIQMMLGVKDIRTARKYVRILIENHSLAMSNPETPTHPDQKYTTVSR